MILAVGNSHANFFTDSLPNTRGYSKHVEFAISAFCQNGSTVAPLAYTFYQKWLPIFYEGIERKSISVNKGDVLIIALGEVDCRVHLSKKYLENEQLSIKDVVTECVDRLFEAILKIKTDGYTPVAWELAPPNKNLIMSASQYPIHGYVDLRNEIVKEWNSYLGQKCKEHNVPLLHIFDRVSELDDNDSYIDEIHLNSKLLLPYMIEQLKEMDLS